MPDHKSQIIPAGARIILVRHGRPALSLRPRTSHGEFRDYIDAYEQAGLDPESLPPQELSDLVKELDHVFTSDRPRAHQSAKALAPHAELQVDSLFAEAPLASPRIPLLRMRVPKWAVIARILWHVGYHPEIENYRKAKHIDIRYHAIRHYILEGKVEVDYIPIDDQPADILTKPLGPTKHQRCLELLNMTNMESIEDYKDLKD